MRFQRSFVDVARFSVCAIAFALGSFVGVASGQTGYLYGVGSPTFTTPSPVEMGFVNLANGDFHIEIPILSLPQRGAMPYTAKLVYDSRIWFPAAGVWSLDKRAR